MRKTSRTLTAGFLALSGSGFLLLSGAGTAHAAPAGAPAPAVCTQLLAASKSYTATLTANQKKFETDRTAYLAAVDNYGSEVTRITSTGSSALQAAAKTYVTDLETEIAASDINQARLNTDDDRMAVLACTPKGAPRTGGGSSAGLRDSALFGAGGAAALAGFILVGLTLRNRSRTSADQG
jgi:hypothetical protein